MIAMAVRDEHGVEARMLRAELGIEVGQMAGLTGTGVDERWKEKYGIWLVRTPDDIEQHAGGFYALFTICTHLGCTPNYLSAENKFKCPCHGSGYRLTGVNFEGKGRITSSDLPATNFSGIAATGRILRQSPERKMSCCGNPHGRPHRACPKSLVALPTATIGTSPRRRG